MRVYSEPLCVCVWQLASNWIGGFQFIAANRRLLKEGKLMKQCRRGLKEFDFVLLTDVLVYGQQVDPYPSWAETCCFRDFKQ